MSLQRYTERAAAGLGFDDTRCVFRIEDWADEYAAGPVTGTSPWISTLLSSGTAATSADGNIGAIVLSGAATTDNSGAQVQWDTEVITLQNGKDAYFGAYFKASEATESHLFRGFAITDTTLLDGADAIAGMTASDCVGFFKPDGGAVWYMIAKTSSAVVLNSAISFTFAANTYYWLEFLVKMTSATDGTIYVYVDRQEVARFPLIGGPTTDMAPSLATVSGTASGTISTTDRKTVFAIEY